MREYHYDQRELILVTLTQTLGLLFALVGNCSVIVIITRTRKLHTPSSVLVLALAISDLILSLVWNLVPMASTLDGHVNSELRSGVACDIIGFTWQTMLTVSTIFHSIVAVDRYLFIVHPLRYQVYVTVKATSVITSIVLVIASSLCCFLFVTGSHFEFVQTAGMCIGSPIWAVLYLSLVFIPSFSVTLFAYQRIWELCSSIFREEDLSRGHKPRMSYVSPIPCLSLSVNSTSKSDLAGIFAAGVRRSSCHEFNDTAKCVEKETKGQMSKKSTTSKQRISTTVTTHVTKVTRKNTVATTTIAHKPCDPAVPVEDPGHHRCVKTVEKRFSHTTDIEQVDKRTSIEQTHSRTGSCDSNKSSPMRHFNRPLGPHVFITAGSTGSLMHTAPNSASIPPPSRLHPAFIPHRHDVVRTLNAQFPAPTEPSVSNETKYEDITNKLFGHDTILPSLLYVAILMPLTIRPCQINNKHRRLRACILVGLPVLILAVNFLPLPLSLIYLGYAQKGDSLENSTGTTVIKILCHLSYALVPSLTSLFLCLNNKPYRNALRQMCRCLWCFRAK